MENLLLIQGDKKKVIIRTQNYTVILKCYIKKQLYQKRNFKHLYPRMDWYIEDAKNSWKSTKNGKGI